MPLVSEHLSVLVRLVSPEAFVVQAGRDQGSLWPLAYESSLENHPSLHHKTGSREHCPQGLIDRRMDMLEATWFPALLRLQVNYTQCSNHDSGTTNPVILFRGFCCVAQQLVWLVPHQSP